MKSRRIAVALVVALLALATAQVASAKVDYSMNAAGGDYAPAISTQVEPTGGTSDSGFAWGAAAVGAGAALALMLAVTLVRRHSGRELPAPRRASAT